MQINHWDEVVVTNDLQMDEGEDDNEEDDQEVDHRNRANKNEDWTMHDFLAQSSCHDLGEMLRGVKCFILL
ncbi:hypothetical protein YC2023_019348 [Brassica napus]